MLRVSRASDWTELVWSYRGTEGGLRGLGKGRGVDPSVYFDSIVNQEFRRVR